MNIICYMGGTCGDLVTSVIDPTDTKILTHSVHIAKERSKLKNSYEFNSTTQKDDYIEKMRNKYLSIPSHDTSYHTERGHEFISITVQDTSMALWAATRFKNLHRLEVWQLIQKHYLIETVEEYANLIIMYSDMIKQHTDKILDLREIINGNLIQQLSKYVSTPLDENLYRRWLQLHYPQI